MEVSFIILNYRSEEYLRRCIKSLASHVNDVSYEIIVVNNDEKPLMIEFDSPNIKVIDNESNNGYAKGCNMGAKSAKGNILFFLNADTEFLTSGLHDFLKVFKTDNIGAAAPRLLTPEGKVQAWSAGNEITLGESIRNNMGLSRNRMLLEKEDIYHVDWVSGAALAIPKKTFIRCGGFDENFFMYFEDVDICRRIRNLGFKVTLVPTTKILHAGGKSYSSAKKQKDHYYKSQDYYFKKHFGSIICCVLGILRKIFT